VLIPQRRHKISRGLRFLVRIKPRLVESTSLGALGQYNVTVLKHIQLVKRKSVISFRLRSPAQLSKLKILFGCLHCFQSKTRRNVLKICAYGFQALGLKRIPVILKHSLRERNSWRIRLGLVVG